MTTILTAVGCCLAAAAYATTRSLAPGSTADGERSPLRPRITEHPDAITTETIARFDFALPGRPARNARPGSPPRLECRMDGGRWEPCAAPVTLSRIDRGGHRFAVRAVNRAGNHGPAADFSWWRARPSAARIVDPTPGTDPDAGQRSHRPTPAHPGLAPPKPQPEAPAAAEPETPDDGPPFTIRQIGVLGDLYPGAPPETIGIAIENPNAEAISVTSLTASIAADPPGCPAAENFVLTPAAVSPAAPLVVAGESSLSLPEAGIAGPTIAMANLPHSQDDCEGDELEISLSGEAG